MYAAELSSDSQLERLQNCYPNEPTPFRRALAGPRLDIYVITFASVQSENRKKGSALAIQLRDLSMSDKNARVSRTVGRIEFVEASLVPNGLAFSLSGRV